MDVIAIYKEAERIIESETGCLHIDTNEQGKLVISISKNFDRDMSMPAIDLFRESGFSNTYTYGSPDQVRGYTSWDSGPVTFCVTAQTLPDRKVQLEVEWVFDSDHQDLKNTVRKLNRVFIAMRMKLEAPEPVRMCR